ncbi:MAG: hypothetical protein JOZ58_21835, partial [Acetobacteraceae bacterium]|nr:hypothetical protein [Acetobacteraceae bacterium]
MRTSRLSIRHLGPGRFVVRHADWFAQPELTAQFLQRTFSAQAVRCDRFEAEIDHLPGLRAEVAAAYRSSPTTMPDLLPDLLDAPPVEGQRRRFCRYGDLISDWT